ncbi:MAG: hypothetical protein K2X47_06830 [Bdellovibrionales bacterium]|nr:hypothetical protein [Bdellovibrionales bacterium]
MSKTDLQRVVSIIQRCRCPYTPAELEADASIVEEVLANSIDVPKIVKSFQDEFSIEMPTKKKSSVHNYVKELVRANKAMEFHFRADGYTPLSADDREKSKFKNTRLRVATYAPHKVEVEEKFKSLGIAVDCPSKMAKNIFVGNAATKPSKDSLSLVMSAKNGELFSINFLAEGLSGLSPATVFVTQGVRGEDVTSRMAIPDLDRGVLKSFGENTLTLKFPSIEIFPQRLLVEKIPATYSIAQLRKLAAEERGMVGPCLGHIAIGLYRHLKYVLLTNMGPSETVEVALLVKDQAEVLYEIKHWIRFGVQWPTFPLKNRHFLEEFPSAVREIKWQTLDQFSGPKLPVVLPGVLSTDSWNGYRKQRGARWEKDIQTSEWTEFLKGRSHVITLPCLIRIGSEHFLLSA